MNLLRMILLLLVPAVAFAQDDTGSTTAETAELPTDPATVPAEVFLEAPDLVKGIAVMPTGSFTAVLVDGEWDLHRLPSKYWLLPDSYYREAVTKAKQLDIYVDALDRCTTRSLEWQKKTADAYDSCLTQFDSDDELIASQVQTIATQATQITSVTLQRDNARRQRNVAWAVTGGLVLGAATVIAVAVAP